MVEGNGFWQSHPDDDNEQQECHVCQRLDNLLSVPDLSADLSGTGSGTDSQRTPRTGTGSGN
jgi:hypothetical protein